MAKVSEKFPEDTDLIVACQKGLRYFLCYKDCSFSYNWFIMRHLEVLV